MVIVLNPIEATDVKALPATIDNEEQNERTLRQVERLIDKGEDNLFPEEETLFRLMTRLIEDFEEQHYKLNAAIPVTILKELMAARDLQAKDLWEGLRLKESDIRGPQR